MFQQQFTPTVWEGRLSQCLQELVDHERWLERELSFLRRQTEDAYGLPNSHDDRKDRVRDRIAGYWGSLVDTPSEGSEYQRNVYGQLSRLQNVLIEHPAMKNAVYRETQGLLALGLNLGTSRNPCHQLIFMLKGLVDHAVEHSPQATANALAQLIQRGEDKDLSSYRILLFRGLYAERRHDFPNGLSIIPFEEVRRFMPDERLRLMLEASDTDINREPIGAVVFESKWGPLIVPAGYDMDGMDWPERPLTFRDDALLLLDVLAVVHRLPVSSSRTHTTVVEREIEHLVGQGLHSSRFVRDLLGVNTTKIEPIATPAISDEKLSECEQLLLSCKEDVPLRLALARLASSLTRTGVHGDFDKVLDVAIALEVVYQLDAKRGKGSLLSSRARQFIGGDRKDLKWIDRTAKSIYAARTGVVHNGMLPEDANQVYEDAFELGQRTLLHAALSGCPARWT
ncbi:MAG: hypothetical protein F4W95_15330 [Chloroflexi bacterium]|nr:hypothetical protein [Chloroflexota bacterium]MYD49829.1 hypothetical protein [Chloroflexota bacterium]